MAKSDCIRSGYVGGQFVITHNILSFSFLHRNYIGSPSEFKSLKFSKIFFIFSHPIYPTSQISKFFSKK